MAATMEAKKVEAPATEPALASVEVPPRDFSEEKSVIPAPAEPKADDSKALAIAEKTPEPAVKKNTSLDRDVALAKVETEKRMSFIKAWEESEKSKVENKAQKKLSAVAAWENSKKAAIEAQLRKIEEELERKKANYAEKMQNKIAAVHKQAEEKRAMVEAVRGEEMLKAQELAAKYRATGHAPSKTFGCFGG